MKKEERVSIEILERENLKYHFWGGMDVAKFSQVKEALARYTICTCHAPANPTFAFEPSRVDHTLIQDYLRSTRGDSRGVRYDGELVLEVSHQGKELTFPPQKWYFKFSAGKLFKYCSRSRFV